MFSHRNAKEQFSGIGMKSAVYMGGAAASLGGSLYLLEGKGGAVRLASGIALLGASIASSFRGGIGMMRHGHGRIGAVFGTLEGLRFQIDATTAGAKATLAGAIVSGTVTVVTALDLSSRPSVFEGAVLAASPSLLVAIGCAGGALAEDMKFLKSIARRVEGARKDAEDRASSAWMN
ncbi:MAG: hypothetical protein KGI00_01320 [Candidatus Micrarchaeota archaeon]|nr:hypothetical protein [Candidatus Micrarchaeota archaeon]MDE1824084.1 hypothetical protein [Candidatus Micrarchaeota archaeon]MDE1849349.1 hypothetical protein [Candidatus Micrarchaeota archaeon]